MIIALLSGFFSAIIPLFTGRSFLRKHPLLFSILPAALFIYFLAQLPAVSSGENLFYHYKWLPSIGVGLNFYLDGLSLLFSLLITGIGTLVFFYAGAYMKTDAANTRFFAFLSAFMASMLGLVLSDDVISLFCFWELTSITSFFLIGYKNEDEGSRKSAYTALAITGGGGLLLLTGLVLMAQITGSFSIRDINSSGFMLRQHAQFGWLVFFILGGAFTKSAQLPFHFWLPAAMKAPTPVSAYLHSATMVKAGVYLAARFTPAFNGHAYWNNTLLIFGGATMLYTAIHALFRTDLKAILAYSTVAALGMLFFLLGIGSETALAAAAVFILVHAFYKAGLFLTAGTVDKVMGTRDVTALSGLGKLMPVLMTAGILAALSSAGFPFTIGFLGKELIYESTLHFSSATALLTTVAVMVNICLLTAGFIAGLRPFVGKLPALKKNFQSPSFHLWLPPLLLGLAGLATGVFPALLNNSLFHPMLSSLGAGSASAYLKIWHGFSSVLLLSGITLAVGTILYFAWKPSKEKLKTTVQWERFSPETIIQNFSNRFEKFAGFFTNQLQTGYLRFYVFTIISFLILLVSYKLFTGVNFYISAQTIGRLRLYEMVVMVVMVISVLVAITSSSRLKAVAALGVTGLSICLVFVFYGAPDLAMTQFTIDTLTVVLFVLVLFKLPHFVTYSKPLARLRDGFLALGFGLLITVIALEVLNEPVDKDISHWYGSNAYDLAHGKNVVNVILVDFRGADTLIEITVLTIAAIGVFSLLKLRVSSREKE